MASIKDLRRMCSSFEDCAECPLDRGDDEFCTPELFDEDVDEIVDKWVQERPVKTYAMDFFEKFPNAKKTESGKPYACRDCLYQNVTRSCSHGCKDDECKKCWDEEMKEYV